MGHRGSKPSILEALPEQLASWLAEGGYPRYRLEQIRRWVFEQPVESFAQMSDLPKILRAELEEHFSLWSTRVIRHHRAADQTEKLLLELPDGESIECVLLRDDREHRTACISTQVGCAMKCVFCASGIAGWRRNLSATEIFEQLLQLKRLLAPVERLTHIVVMGMGEPLANLPNLLPALQRATDPRALGLSARRITISTVGLPAGIRHLAEVGTPYHLAISLHAPNDQLRNRLVPKNEKIGIRAILAAADHYFRVTGRRVTFEYVLLAGVNDLPEHARQLASLLQGQCALVNVIPYNPVAGLPFRSPAPAAVSRFCEILRQAGINVQVRVRRGDQIDAACGQLRLRTLAESVATASEKGPTRPPLDLHPTLQPADSCDDEVGGSLGLTKTACPPENSA